MMNQKFDAFVLHLSFIGWELLAVFTCGIVGIFWSIPYYYATEAELYAVLRNACCKGRIRVMDRECRGRIYNLENEG